jgi:hypothetical protein
MVQTLQSEVTIARDNRRSNEQGPVKPDWSLCSLSTRSSRIRGAKPRTLDWEE